MYLNFSMNTKVALLLKRYFSFSTYFLHIHICTRYKRTIDVIKGGIEDWR